MSALSQDLRLAFRTLLRRPAFAAVAALTLALGIGANTTIFSLVHGILLRPLPYPEPERLVEVWNRWEGSGQSRLAGPEFVTYHDRGRSFAAVAATLRTSVNLTGDGEPERVRAVAASSEIFAVLGVEAARGRLFGPDEDVPGGEPVAVVSHELWQRRFGGDPALVGRDVLLDGVAATVLGVLPPDTRLPGDLRLDTRTDVWLPLRLDPAAPGPWGMHNFEALGRLAPGVDLAAAQAEMDVVVEHMKQAAAAGERDAVAQPSFGVRLWPVHEQVVGAVETPLLILLGAVALVLAIACANVANLLLVRAESRRRELALRAAVGASRTQLLRPLLVESLVLAALGGAGGLLIGTWGLELFVWLLPANVPRLSEVALDANVLLVTIAGTLATGLLFGLLPALQVARDELNPWLREGERETGGGRRRHRLRSTLVIAEMALAAVLVIAAGLLIRSFWNLRQVDPGFRTENVLTLRLELPQSAYPEPADVAGFFRDARRRLAALPGVEQAGGVTHVPLAMGRGDWNFYPEGRVLAPGEPTPSGDWQVVTPGYFEALDIAVVEGRTFDDRDEMGAPPVLVVNHRLAERYWPDASPLGRRVRLGGRDDNPYATIVGVVADIRFEGLGRDPVPEIYVPQAQAQTTMGFGPWRSLSWMLRTAIPPQQLTAAVRAEIAALDADLPVTGLATMAEIRAGSLTPTRLPMVLLTAFAVLALALGAVGIFGVVSYAVICRKREIGVRMALGARRENVVSLVVGQGMRLAGIGLVIGLALAFAVARVLGSLLFGIAPADPATFAAVAAVLVLAAFSASYLPARRAASIDPIQALREE